MFQKLFGTSNDHTLTVLRVTLGAIMFLHGAQKMLGWFGGNGFDATMGHFTTAMHIPAPLAFLAIAAEFFGGIGLMIGLLSRIAAFGIAVNMLVAITMVHAGNGIFMNWSGTQKGEGFEFHLLAIAISIAVMLHGSGAWSVDRFLASAEHPLGTHGAHPARA